MNYQRMIELKRSLQELVLADALDLPRIQAEHTEFIALRAEHNAEVAEQEEQRQAKLARQNAIRSERRAVAEKMTKAELIQATGTMGTRFTREGLISLYADMGVPPL